MNHPQPGCPHPRSLFHAPTRYALQALVRMPGDGTYRLARNLAGHKFLNSCSDEEKTEILESLKAVIMTTLAPSKP